jgi:hypothetical protein
MCEFEILDPLEPSCPLSLGGTRWLPARPFSAIPLYPWFQLVFSWPHRYYVVADGGVMRGKLISVILAGDPLTSPKLQSSRRESSAAASYPLCWWVFFVTPRILRSTGRRGHPPQLYIPHSSSCFCGLQEITSLRTTLARSESKCVALSEMRTIRWDLNGIHASTIRNLISREASD